MPCTRMKRTDSTDPTLKGAEGIQNAHIVQQHKFLSGLSRDAKLFSHRQHQQFWSLNRQRKPNEATLQSQKRRELCLTEIKVGYGAVFLSHLAKATISSDQKRKSEQEERDSCDLVHRRQKRLKGYFGMVGKLHKFSMPAFLKNLSQITQFTQPFFLEGDLQEIEEKLTCFEDNEFASKDTKLCRLEVHHHNKNVLGEFPYRIISVDSYTTNKQCQSGKSIFKCL